MDQAPAAKSLARRRRALPPMVIALGVTSLLTDVGTEMIFPLLPIFLVQHLGASPAFLGIVEGTADAVASLLKLASGHLSDRWRSRKPLVLAGYGLASAVRPFVALATAPWHVLAVRVTDRVGKGIRTAPRDALLADAAAPGEVGRAFGFHQAMDHAGAVAGPLVATALVGYGMTIRHVFAWAALPGALATLAVLLAREPTPRASTPAPTPVATGGARLPARFVTFLAILALFSLGNSSDAFLLLRAHDLGVSTATIPILWAALSVSKLASAYLAGDWSDRFPRARFIVAGWGVYALSYLGLGRAESPWQVWTLFLLYGSYYGLTEPTQKALVKDLVPTTARGRAFGYYNFVVGVSALPAGLLTGWLWHVYGPRAALEAGALVAGVALLLMCGWVSWVGPARAN
jgi:MFS family permease